ncbi:bZIP transcription factor, putative [Talaromyces stipitatus ATCC 10500]|uniref:BZIP transcription factor, putative n=1 Tax=Talaromyces stipitatus (strain ATCC 10500 / CBS 375.48 / QM 6759 / NRRL 1006) TaxID=441959 RepID=B8MQI9_TALSN|nr:bZIP transcription factor, putative [Talaromyces stipitatus ATCC 10500]EED13391.1 bZIP transcription factor, putative [Talaromyces stipitatus ATCC 10500]
MARFTQQPFEFYQESSSTLDPKPTFCEEDEMSVLDDKILDSTPDVSGISDPRRSSYDQHADALSYRESVWGDFTQQQQPHQSHVAPSLHPDASRQDSHVPSSIPMYDSGNQFMRLDTAQSNAAYTHQAAWPMSRGSGSCTPTPVYDQFAQDYDASSAGAFSGGAVGPVSAINFGQMSSYRGNMFGAPGSVAMSPQSSQGWMQTGEMVDGRPARSPTYRTDSNLHLRRDGIRKKNARFEIPAERTLSNIDQLIAQSTNEEEIKELKQQKRLLRNRQAALDSRQRKKLHTEKLEEEKKQFTTVITDLEEALHNMKIRESELLREKTEWMNAQQQFQQWIEGLQMEKDELIRVHTLETAELRKKNNILRETMEKMEQQFKSMGKQHSNAFATNGFGEFDSLHMESGPWDEMSLVNNISLEAEGLSAPVDANNDNMTAMVPVKNEKAEKIFNNQNSDYPFSWNAFYMCLLFGAFIASNSTSLSSPAALPQLSDEYRAESANVLKAVLASAPADVSSSTIQHLPTTISGAEMAHMTSGSTIQASTLDELHKNLALPSKQQENEQVFALNPEQYNALTTFQDDSHNTNMDFGDKPQQQPSNLQQALAAMRGNNDGGRTSEVYSRSLMWDRVPEKVVRDFQRMVRECGATK